MKIFQNYLEIIQENQQSNRTIKEGIKSLIDQNFNQLFDETHCEQVSAAFVYFMNTGKSVEAGEKDNFKDLKKSNNPWGLIKVTIEGEPHIAAYNKTENLVVDLTLKQFNTTQNVNGHTFDLVTYLQKIVNYEDDSNQLKDYLQTATADID
jgi:hypothetical protein